MDASAGTPFPLPLTPSSLRLLLQALHSDAHLYSSHIYASARMHDFACRAFIMDVDDAQTALATIGRAISAGLIKPKYARTFFCGPLTARPIPRQPAFQEGLALAGWRCTGDIPQAALSGAYGSHKGAAPAGPPGWWSVSSAAPLAHKPAPTGDTQAGVTPSPVSPAASGMAFAAPKSSLGLGMGMGIEDDYYRDSAVAAWERVVRRVHRCLGAAAVTQAVVVSSPLHAAFLHHNQQRAVMPVPVTLPLAAASSGSGAFTGTTQARLISSSGMTKGSTLAPPTGRASQASRATTTSDLLAGLL